ncbi:MAG: hydroxyisourate hydrolase [Burkholderiales bacterium]
MPGISVHVVDVAFGKPAAGMFVEVHALDGDTRRVVGTGCIGDNGAFEHPMNAGDGVAAGTHEVLLHAGEYFRFVGQVTDKPAFQEIVPLRFTVQDAAQHYHLPVKISPWGISVWRGA